MKKEIFKTIIADFQGRDLSRVIDRDISIPLDSGKVVSIIGVRRSGKTHVLFSLIRHLRHTVDPRSIVYINFEDDRLFPLQTRDLADMLDAYYELYPDRKNAKVYFFFDEIEQVAGWETFIRRIHDSENCAVFVTGSSSRLLSREIASALRGRTISYEVFPLSFREYLRFKGLPDEYHASKNRARIRHAFEAFMRLGAFPEVAVMDADIAVKTLQEYIDLIIYRDVVERHNISNTFFLKYLIKFCCANVSTLVSINKMYNDFKSQGLQISRNTMYDYLSFLEDAYALFTVPLHARSQREAWRNPRKVYSIDVGFKHVMDYETARDAGRIYENLVFLELRRDRRDIVYIKQDREVDFYCPADGLLINVCYDLSAPATRQREIDGLAAAMEALSIRQGFVLTAESSQTVAVPGGDIRIAPLWQWLLEKKHT